MYEYKVETLREGPMGGAIQDDDLQGLLNKHAKDGWRLIDVMPGLVKGRIGANAVQGALVTFEREVRAG